MFLFAIAGVCLLGWLIVNIIHKSDSLFETIGLSFLIGLSIFTLILFSANFFLGLRLNQFTGWVILLSLVLAGFVVNRFRLPKISELKPDFPRLPWQKLILGLLIFLPLANLLVSFWLPVVDWDAVTMFDFRAMIILDTGWIRDTLFRSSILAYPLLTTLSHFWLYANGISTAMPLYPLFYIAFILVSCSQVKRIVPGQWILPATLFLAVSPKMFDQSLVAYANLPYTVFLVTGSVYLYLWLKGKRKGDLILGLLLSLFSLWARSFPFAVANILAVFLLYPKTRKSAVIMTAILGLFGLIYTWPLDVSRLVSVLAFGKWAVFDYYFPYNWIFVALLLREIYLFKRLSFWPLLISLYILLFIAGNYYFAGQYADYAGLPDAAQRMMMFLNPAILWYVFSIL